MTSWTEPVRASDPFPQLVELPTPVGGVGRGGDDLDAARAQAIEQGYQAGFDRGLADGVVRGEADGRRAVAERVEEVLAQIAAAADRARADDALVAASMGATLVDVAVRIAEAVIGREVATSQGAGREALERALRVAPDDGHLIARLHPDDARLLDASTVPTTSRRTIEVLADSRIERGGCIVDTPSGAVDALLSTALARVAAALAGDDDRDEAGEATA
jgi:flagellar assembly protein FliH